MGNWIRNEETCDVINHSETLNDQRAQAECKQDKQSDLDTYLGLQSVKGFHKRTCPVEAK